MHRDSVTEEYLYIQKVEALPRSAYSKEREYMLKLKEMGLTDFDKNLDVIRKSNLNFDEIVEKLLWECLYVHIYK